MTSSKIIKGFDNIIKTDDTVKGITSKIQNKSNFISKKKKIENSFEEDYLKRVEQKQKEQTEALFPTTSKLLSSLAAKNSTDLFVKEAPKRTGGDIKSNIRNVLSEKYGELDTNHLFDDIDDKDVEDNLETAENAIKINVDRGNLSKDYSSLLPNLRDGLALSYAAASKGKNKEAIRAREAAYTEQKEPAKIDVQTKISNNTNKQLKDLLKKQNGSLSLPTKPKIDSFAIKKDNVPGVVNNKIDNVSNRKVQSYGKYDYKDLISDMGVRLMENDSKTIVDTHKKKDMQYESEISAQNQRFPDLKDYWKNNNRFTILPKTIRDPNFDIAYNINRGDATYQEYQKMASVDMTDYHGFQNGAVLQANAISKELLADKTYAHAANLTKEILISEDSFAYDAYLFRKKYMENYEIYDRISKATDMPAPLIAAIHYRESGCDFNTYLHNGQPLGKTTTCVPKNILFYEFEPAAISAMNSMKKEKGSFNLSASSKDVVAMCAFAEKYNGMGYYNKGRVSPYVYSGTNKYTAGKYTSDGNYNNTVVDKQPGVYFLISLVIDDR